MAGNAKQYNDLNSTKVVNSADKVALAQENQTELVTTTVGDLANAVGELNQAGALAELSLATSIGKNLLAQRLNEKGVECAPTDTLVSMADKVNNLVIDGQKTNVISPVITSLTDNGSTNREICMQYVGTKENELGSLVILDQTTNTINLVPNGAYASLDAAIASAVVRLDVPANTGRKRTLAISQNEKYVITDIDTNRLNVYEVNAQAGTLTLKHEITTKNAVYAATSTDYAEYNQYLTVSNDGDRYAFWSSNNKVAIGSITKDKELLTDSLNNGVGQFPIFFLEGTNFVTVLRPYTSSSYGSIKGYGKIEYNFEKGTINIYDISSALGSSHYFEPRTQTIIKEEIIVDTSLPYRNAGVHKITIYSPMDLSVLFSGNIRILVPLYAISGKYSKAYGAEGMFFQVLCDNTNNAFSFISPIYGKILDYNKNNSTFVVHNRVSFMSLLDYNGTIISYKDGVALQVYISRGNNVITNAYGNNLGSHYSATGQWTDKDYYIGSIRTTSDGKIGVFTMQCADADSMNALIDSGLLATETTAVEIK